MLQAVKNFFGKHWLIVFSILMLLGVMLLIYKAGKKTGSGTTIVSDTGTGPTPAEIEKAKSLATRLHNDLTGLNWTGHDDSIYLELAQTSNVVFGLTFGEYRQMFNASLIADINDDSFGNWDVITVIINRATALNLN